jgi:hypothetical protein
VDLGHRRSPLPEVAVLADPASEFERALQRRATHGLAADEVPTSIPRSDPVARLAPVSDRVLRDFSDQPPVFRRPAAASVRINDGAIGEIAVTVDLTLAVSVIAEIAPGRMTIAWEVISRAFFYVSTAVDPLYHLKGHLGRRTEPRLPAQVMFGALDVPEHGQGRNRHRGVAYLGIPAVVVAVTADPLGKRARGRRDERSGRREREQFDRQR